MKVFKAINYKEGSPKNMSSEFCGKYLEHSCLEDIFTTAFSHISHGDRKQTKDYWISTTKDIHKAIELLQDKKYSYNGIAIIDLPNTKQTGYIYDENLREKGYIKKYIIDDISEQKWKCNNDGIVYSLDMSSAITINYLASYLWLKGNRKSLGNIRTYLNANSKQEVLLLGENISFEFISKDDIEKFNIVSKLPKEKNIINDYNIQIVKNFIELAPESKFKNEEILCLNKIIPMDASKYNHYNSFEMENKRKEIISLFYKNARYTFDRKRAGKSFRKLNNASDKCDFSKPYDDKDVIFSDYLWAYICSEIYISLKLSGKLEERNSLWQILNELYEKQVICGDVKKEDFFNYYIKGLGIFPNEEHFDFNDFRNVFLDIDSCGLF